MSEWEEAERGWMLCCEVRVVICGVVKASQTLCFGMLKGGGKLMRW